jgi:hypothetical protein
VAGRRRSSGRIATAPAPPPGPRQGPGTAGPSRRRRQTQTMAPARRQAAAQERADLHGGGVVGVVGRVQPAGVHRGGPGVAREAQLCDPLERPAGDDRLAGRMPRGVVVVAALGRASASQRGQVVTSTANTSGSASGKKRTSRSRSCSVSMRPRTKAASTLPQPRWWTGSKLRWGSDGIAGRTAARRPARTAHRHGGCSRRAARSGSRRAAPGGRLASAWPQPDGLTTHRQLKLHKQPHRVKSQAKRPA